MFSLIPKHGYLNWTINKLVVVRMDTLVPPHPSFSIDLDLESSPLNDDAKTLFR